MNPSDRAKLALRLRRFAEAETVRMLDYLETQRTAGNEIEETSTQSILWLLELAERLEKL